MGTFKLPDLGEGLAEAEILEWHVKPGDHVLVDAPLVSVETAKAVVEVPVPCSGTVTALHGAVGDIIATGAPLVDFDSRAMAGSLPVMDSQAFVEPTTGARDPARAAPRVDFESRAVPLADVESGTVVGSMPVTRAEEFFESPALAPVVPVAGARDASRPRAVPLARALAKRLGLDLAAVAGTGPGGVVRVDDVLAQTNLGEPRTSPRVTVPVGASAAPLKGARRAMAHSMSASRDQISGSTVCDDADIHAWTQRGDYLLRLIRALIAACDAEPALNAWYDAANTARILLAEIHLGIAVDTPGGLFMPVLRDIRRQPPDALRAAITAHKEAAHGRRTAPEDMRGFTLILSNFGTLAGRYGIPLVVPPAVAILGAGKVRLDPVVAAGSVVAHRRLPLSLSFDHRCVTGGEACRFLAAAIVDLEKAD